MGDLEELLKIDLTSTGITKRNPKKLDYLKSKTEKLKKYFNPEDVDVKLITDTGFNSLGFISIRGKAIRIYDKEILKIIKENASYVNIIIDDRPDNITFEIGYVDLCK